MPYSLTNFCQHLGSDYHLLPIQCQAITWTNAGLLSIGPSETKFNEILIKMQHSLSRKCNWNLCLQNGGTWFSPEWLKKSSWPISFELVLGLWNSCKDCSPHNNCTSGITRFAIGRWNTNSYFAHNISLKVPNNLTRNISQNRLIALPEEIMNKQLWSQ